MVSPAQRFLAFVASDPARAEALIPSARADSRAALLALADASGVSATEVRALLQTDLVSPTPLSVPPPPVARAAHGGARAGATTAHFALRAGPQAIVERALANATANTSQIAADAFAAMATRLVGLNSGSDRITEVVTHTAPNDHHFTPHPHIEAFDRAGHHVLNASFVRYHEDPKTLHIMLLKASHGRDVEGLSFDETAASVPGRGNARVVSEVLRQVIEIALDNGFSRLEVTPGFSARVAELYGDMGFRPLHGGAPSRGDALSLDLRDETSVRQMLQFVSARALVADVPKNVAARLAAIGEQPAPAARAAFVDKLDTSARWFTG